MAMLSTNEFHFRSVSHEYTNSFRQAALQCYCYGHSEFSAMNIPYVFTHSPLEEVFSMFSYAYEIYRDCQMSHLCFDEDDMEEEKYEEMNELIRETFWDIDDRDFMIDILTVWNHYKLFYLQTDSYIRYEENIIDEYTNCPLQNVW